MKPFMVVLYLFTAVSFCNAGGSRFSGSQQNAEVMKHLKRLNKRPIRSIQSPDGDIIDCIHISHQPAFDHPFLKNHTIQMRPNYHPNWINDMNIKVTSSPPPSSSSSLYKDKGIVQLWHVNGECPNGTIPVRRTKKEDILRATSVKRYGKKKSFTTVAQPSSTDPDNISQNSHQHAIAYVKGEYYGAKATMNVWNPKIQQINEFSLSQIWILGGSFGSDLNSIEAGWQVNPDLYGDNNTRLFIYWTSDAYQATGCYNLMCSGFIQTNNEIAIGGSISPISELHGSQYDITILIWKDPEEGNWWMQFGNGKVLGYWPSTLFSYLTKSASLIEWGGEVVNTAANGQHTTTQMGSGEFPEEGFGKASYFRYMEIVDESNSLRDPKDIGIFTEQSNCYNVQMSTDGNWGSHFYYGGPGRNPNCP
ncbi:protein neprosin-like [Rutidosis leptorrhynchoides]|uniref:protein neprosin-like n=1 Tax=Rutidosis leptorrhynchoides TaxID=125765 RepID=UPI003A990DB8